MRAAQLDALEGWLDHATLQAIKSICAAGFAGADRNAIINTVIALAAKEQKLGFVVPRNRVRDAISRLRSLGAIEVLSPKSKPPKPTPPTPKQINDSPIFGAFGAEAQYERELAAWRRACKDAGNTKYRAIGLLDQIARAAQ